MEIPSWGAFFSVTLTSMVGICGRTWTRAGVKQNLSQIHSDTRHSPCPACFLLTQGKHDHSENPGLWVKHIWIHISATESKHVGIQDPGENHRPGGVHFLNYNGLLQSATTSQRLCVRHLLQRWRDGCPCPFAPWDTQQNEMREELKIWPPSEDRLALFLKTPFWGPPDASGEI